MLAQAQCWEESQGREASKPPLPHQPPAPRRLPGLGASLENRLIPGTARNTALLQREHESQCSLPAFCQWLANTGLQESDKMPGMSVEAGLGLLCLRKVPVSFGCHRSLNMTFSSSVLTHLSQHGTFSPIFSDAPVYLHSYSSHTSHFPQ